MQNYNYQNTMNPYQQPIQNQNVGQLPVPCTHVMHPYIQLTYGQPTFMPNVQCPPHMQHYLPIIVQQAMDIMQSEAGRAQPSALRMFMFNLLGGNQFQNNDFVSFVQDCVKLIIMHLETKALGNIDIQTAIKACVDTYCEYYAASTVKRYGALLQYIDRNTAMLCDEKVNNFNRRISGLEQALQRQNQPMQNQQYHMGQNGNQYGQPIGGGGGMPFNYGQQPTGGMGGGATSYLGSNQNNASSNWNDEKLNKYDSYTFNNAAELSEPVREANNFEVKVETRSFNMTPPVADQIPVIDYVQDEEDERAIRQELERQRISGSSALPAFNPNVSEVKQRKSIPIVCRKKIPVKREQHLAVPTIANTWGVTIKSDEQKTPVVDVVDTIPTSLEDVVITPAGGAANAAFDHKEHWAVLETTMLDIKAEDTKKAKEFIAVSVRKKRTFTRMVTSLDIVVEPVVVACDTITAVVEIIDKTEVGIDVPELLLSVKTNAVQANDQNVLNAIKIIDKRLTNSINDFVRNELALTTGTIDSFMDDFNDLNQYILAAYGESASDAFLGNKARVIKRALTTGTPEFLDLIKSMYFGFLEEDSTLKVTPFASAAAYALIDLTSIELQLDIANSKSAVGLIEQDFPLLHSIAKRLMDSALPDDIAVNHYFLRSNDKVIYEFTRGAINPDFIFVSVKNQK